MNQKLLVMRPLTLFVILLFCVMPCSAQSAGKNDTEIKRLLNAAFDKWLDDPAIFKESKESDVLVEDARRFAEIGFFDDAFLVVERAVASGRTDQAGDAVVAVMLELLEQGEIERALALIDQFEQQMPDVLENLSWRDHALEFVVQFLVDHNKPDHALKVIDLMAGKFPISENDLSEADKVKWNCYSLIANTQARNGEPQRGLDLLKSVRDMIPQEDLDSIIEAAITCDHFDWAVPYLDKLPTYNRWSHAYDAFQSAIWGSDFRAAEKIAEYCAEFDPEASAEFYARIAFAENDAKATKKWRELAIEACSPLPQDARTIFIVMQLRRGELESAIQELSTIDQDELYLDESFRQFLIHAIDRAANEDGQLRANAALQSIEPEWLRLKIMLELATERLANGNPESADELVQEVKSRLSSVPIEKLHEFWPGSPHRILAKFGFYNEAVSFLNLTAEKFDDGYQLSKRFQIASLMLDRGDKEACLALLSDAEQVDELPSIVIDGIVNIATKSGCAIAIEILASVSARPNPGVGYLISVMVEQSDHETAEQFWRAEQARIQEADSMKLIEISKKTLFDPDYEYSVGYLLTELRGLEKVFSTTPEILLPIANGFAKLGQSQDVFRIMDSMSDIWNESDLIPVYRMLVETGQLSAVLKRQETLNDRAIKNYVSEFRARHELLTGRTRQAIQIAESIENKQQKRELLIQCAVQLRSPYLSQLRAIDNWLESIAWFDGDLIFYPVAAETPEQTSMNLYSGMSGIMRFYLEMHEVTGDELYRMKFRRIARTLANEAQRLTVDSDPGFFYRLFGHGNDASQVVELNTPKTSQNMY